ncbi:DUF2442 domain-containing protein [Pseudomonas aeruginosa]
MSKSLTLRKVIVMSGYRLFLVYRDNAKFVVDFRAMRSKFATNLLVDDRFATAKIGEHGLSVQWMGDENLEMAADNLRAEAIHQAGDYSHQTVIEWMHQHELTNKSGAEALGISTRMLAYYRSGEKPVPKSIGLAMVGWAYSMKYKKSLSLELSSPSELLGRPFKMSD